MGNNICNVFLKYKRDLLPSGNGASQRLTKRIFFVKLENKIKREKMRRRYQVMNKIYCHETLHLSHK